MHKLNVQEKYYNLLKSENKTIELRLFDEKRASIQINDLIEFKNGADESDTFIAEVVNLHKANNFNELCSIITPLQAGFQTKEDLLKVLEEFYSLEKQQNFGVVGIEIKKKH